MTPRALSATLAVLAFVLQAVSACTGVRIREFTRESYEPGAVLEPQARVFAAPRKRVFDALVASLERRGAQLKDSNRESGRLLAAVPWAGPGEASASVALGRVRRVVTRAKRTYRSYSPLDFRCNGCVVQNGRITGQETRLVEDVTLPLAAASYRLEAVLGATVETVEGGTRVELVLDVVAAPREPPGLLPRSTGQLESSIFATLEGRLR
jgi:hypothetical protein